MTGELQHENNATTKNNTVIPVIDISPFVSNDDDDDDDARKEQCALLWDDAMSKVGFAIIVGHGVNIDKVQSLRHGFLQFFERRDLTYKNKYNHGPYGNKCGGYTGVGGEAVARSQDGHGDLGNNNGNETIDEEKAKADPVESFSCSGYYSPEKTASKKQFVTDQHPSPKSPSLPVEFESAAIEYHEEMRRILVSLNRMSERALNLPDGYFEQFYRPKPNYYLNAKYYPPSSASTKDSVAAETNEGLRYGAHTDYTGFTILKQDDRDNSTENSGGLQVRPSNSDTWQPVLPSLDGFVVNIGDLYEDWTNGRWKSTAHRVVSPKPESEASTISRLSMPFFSGPHDDALIETLPTCLPSKSDDEKTPISRLMEPIRAGDHLQKKLKATQV